MADNFIYPAPTATRPHAPIGLGSSTLTYDANGNMVSDGERTLTFDDGNRLASVTMPSGTVTRFGYGADGSRAWKQSGTTSSFYFGGEADLTAPMLSPMLKLTTCSACSALLAWGLGGLADRVGNLQQLVRQGAD